MWVWVWVRHLAAGAKIPLSSTSPQYATSYLHSVRIVHRDIKSENFLLLGEPGTREENTIKLCDFGTAVQLSDQKPRAMEVIGTLSYTAPEIYGNRGATVVADNWSLGVVLYVLLVGASPFRTSGNESREETMRRIQAGDFETRRPAWQSLTPFAQELVRKFLVVEEPLRLASKKALWHSWMDAGDGRSQLARLAPSSMLPPAPRGTGGGDLQNYCAYGQTLVMLLEKFAHLDAMQQLVLIICAQTMAEVDLINCQTLVPWYDLFFALDRNEDGQLSFSEFVTGLKQLLGSAIRHSDEQLDMLVRSLDLDCSGQIEWVEWAAVALLAVQSLVQEAEPLSTAFRLLDRPSGDGIIGVADMLAVINSDAKTTFLSSEAGREHVLRILSRWAPTPPELFQGAASAVPPSLKLEDLRKVLESCSKDEEDRPMPPLRSQDSGIMWCRPIPWACPSEQRVSNSTPWCPGTKTEINVMVHQQSALSPQAAKAKSPKDPSAIAVPVPT
jgi:serine/threonine protein kinase